MKKIGFMILLLFAFLAPGFSSEITVYTALEDDQIMRYLDSFKKKYPDIKVNIVRDSTGVIAAKLISEKNNPVADVVWGTAVTNLIGMDDLGMLEEYSPAGIERVLQNFKDTKNKVPHWVGIDIWETAFVCNTVELKKRKLPVPATYKDLLNPVYRGQIVMSHPASSGTGYLTVSAILQLMGENKGWEYMDKLNENIAQYVHSGSKPAKMAGQGEFLIGISFGYRGIIQKQKGEPVTTVFPKEGSGWDMESNALIKKKKIKNEAKLFLDWAISDDAMKEYIKSFAIISVKNNYPVPEGYSKQPLKQLIKNDFYWTSKNRDRILQEWSKRYESKSAPK